MRRLLLGASPPITEGIQWNLPSFRVQEWFARLNLRRDVVLVVLHLGAKVKDGSTSGMDLRDPKGAARGPEYGTRSVLPAAEPCRGEPRSHFSAAGRMDLVPRSGPVRIRRRIATIVTATSANPTANAPGPSGISVDSA